MKPHNISNHHDVASPFFENKIWMNSKDAADYLRVSINSLRMKVWRNQVHAHKEGRRLLFRKSDLDRLIRPLKKGTL